MKCWPIKYGGRGDRGRGAEEGEKGKGRDKKQIRQEGGGRDRKRKGQEPLDRVTDP